MVEYMSLLGRKLTELNFRLAFGEDLAVACDELIISQMPYGSLPTFLLTF